MSSSIYFKNKKSAKAISELGNHFDHIQRIKIALVSKFRGCIANGKEVTIETSSEHWAQLPLSRNRTRGYFPEWVYILSCIAYQLRIFTCFCQICTFFSLSTPFFFCYGLKETNATEMEGFNRLGRL